jgi:tryptophanyl-tRNA synthetase
MQHTDRPSQQDDAVEGLRLVVYPLTLQAKSKDKVACLGLYSYPELMAADILLYKSIILY